ncbi:MAG TPA: aminoglycoside phosphotransferase family protein [Nocardioidaceae bacterium]|nr:aminoglycoside phosphotransferase family protein [Nocardioidaceae bacterium]
MLPFDIPPGLAGQVRLGEPWVSWLDRLPAVTGGVLEEWELEVDGAPMNGFCSLVVPVRTSAGRPAVLKVALPDEESDHEHLALQRWQGDGAVLLLRADPHRRALLLERLHPEDLTDLWDLEACEIVAGLYRRLHVPALPQLRTMTSYVERRNTGLAAMAKDAPMPRRLVEQALSLAAGLLSDAASTGRMIHGDLHYENVLAADREPWLVIDPKPMSGDPHYEVAPLLWNRWDEVVESGAVRDAVRRRFHTVVDTAELDEDRARDWVVVRALQDASWAVDDARRLGRELTRRERAWITTMVTVAKAVQG